MERFAAVSACSAERALGVCPANRCTPVPWLSGDASRTAPARRGEVSRRPGVIRGDVSRCPARCGDVSRFVVRVAWCGEVSRRRAAEGDSGDRGAAVLVADAEDLARGEEDPPAVEEEEEICGGDMW